MHVSAELCVCVCVVGGGGGQYIPPSYIKITFITQSEIQWNPSIVATIWD